MSEILMRTGGSISFVENDGGALALVDGSLEIKAEVSFLGNYAHQYGVGVFYEDKYSKDFKAMHLTPGYHHCFYGLLIATDDLEPTIAETDMRFCNNTAGVAGTAIYGGWMEMCALYINFDASPIFLAINAMGKYNTSEEVVDSLFSFHEHSKDLALISSNPTRVCVCTTDLFPDCNITDYTITAYPGETFTIIISSCCGTEIWNCTIHSA